MKIYILTQSSYHEGNFGDLEYSGEIIIGVYSTKELAEQAMKSLKIETFYAQFGAGESTPSIIERELDSDLTPVGISNKSHRDNTDEEEYIEPDPTDSYNPES